MRERVCHSFVHSFNQSINQSSFFRRTIAFNSSVAKCSSAARLESPIQSTVLVHACEILTLPHSPDGAILKRRQQPTASAHCIYDNEPKPN